MRPTRAQQLAETLERELRASTDPVRAEGAKRYLKSELEFIGITTDQLRRAVRAALRDATLDRPAIHELIETLWSRGVFELRAAAMEVLIVRAPTLGLEDLELLEKLLRDAHTWALVDGIAAWIVGAIIEQAPEATAVLDRWSRDRDFWLRRAAMLALLLPLRRGAGDWERFTRYADTMLEEREFFIRKAIGWVLREVGKKRPHLVVEWLLPRASRAAGLVVREAIRYLPVADRTAILTAHKSSRA
jgi:3-methyladenine DNA glycosylase AlkD